MLVETATQTLWTLTLQDYVEGCPIPYLLEEQDYKMTIFRNYPSVLDSSLLERTSYPQTFYFDQAESESRKHYQRGNPPEFRSHPNTSNTSSETAKHDRLFPQLAHSGELVSSFGLGAVQQDPLPLELDTTSTSTNSFEQSYHQPEVIKWPTNTKDTSEQTKSNVLSTLGKWNMTGEVMA